MKERLGHLEQYLENTERMMQALSAEDLETVNRCLDINADLMKVYGQTRANEGGVLENKVLKEKIEAILKANRRCVFLAENKCLALKTEMEGTDKNRMGIKKYGARQVSPPRFIDNTL